MTAAGTWTRAFTIRVTALAGLAILLIGMASALGGVIGELAGPGIVTRTAAGVTYTADRCADFERLQPGVTDCIAAAERHHLDEVEQTALIALLIGSLTLVASLRAIRSHGEPEQVHLFALIGFVGFGGVAILLIPYGLLEVVGAGGNISTLLLGVVSGGAAIGFVPAGVRAARHFAADIAP